MKLSISEARKRLPDLVRRVRKGNGAKVEITIHDEVVAELRGATPAPQPGAAASKQLLLMRKLPKHRGRRTNVSNHVNISIQDRRNETVMVVSRKKRTKKILSIGMSVPQEKTPGPDHDVRLT